MQQDKIIKIDINLSASEIRSLESSIQDLLDAVNILGSSFQTTQNSIQTMGSEFNLFEAVFKVHSDTMVHLRSGLFILGNDYEKLMTSVATLTGKKSLLVGATQGLTGAFAIKGTTAKIAASGVAVLTSALKFLPFIGIASAAWAFGSSLLGLFQNTTNATDATDEYVDSMKNLRNQLLNNQNAHDSNIRSIDAQNKTMRGLVDTILSLNSETDLKVEEYNQLRIATDLLNDSTSGYAVTIDEATGRLDENGVQVALSMARYHDLAAATEEVEEHLTRLLELQNEENYASERVGTLTYAYADLNTQLEEYRGQLEPYQAELDEINQSMSSYGDISKEANERQLELRDSINGIEESMAYLDEQIESTGEELEHYRTILTDAEENIEDLEYKLIEAYENMDEATTRYVSNQMLSWDSLSEHQQGVMNDLKAKITEYTDHAQNRMDYLCDNVTVTGREMINNMEKNQGVLETWADNIAILANRGIDEGLLDEMRRMGPEGAAEVAAMVAMCDDEFDEMNEVYARGAEIATDVLATQLGEGFDYAVDMASHFVKDKRTTMIDEIANADFESIGKSIPDGAAVGIEDNERAVDATRDTVKIICDTFKHGIGYSSPSRVFKSYGESIIQGLVRGIDLLEDQPKNQLQSLATAMKAVYDTARSDYQSIGQTMMDGLNAGLLGREHTLMSTARRIASQIRQTIDAAINQTSAPTPSFAGAGAGATHAPAPMMLADFDFAPMQKRLHDLYYSPSPAFMPQLPISSAVRNINYTTNNNHNHANRVTLNMGSNDPKVALMRTNRYLDRL